MAKFIKSIFNTAERRKSCKYEETDEEKVHNFAPPMDGRRKLSISRSGRLKQANKKRHSLSIDIYNQEIQTAEITKNTERSVTETKKSNIQRSHSAEGIPDEEIDNAFEIIERT